MTAEDSQQKLKEFLEDILTRNEFDLEEFAYSLSPKTCIKKAKRIKIVLKPISKQSKHF